MINCARDRAFDVAEGDPEELQWLLRDALGIHDWPAGVLVHKSGEIAWQATGRALVEGVLEKLRLAIPSLEVAPAPASRATISDSSGAPSLMQTLSKGSDGGIFRLTAQGDIQFWQQSALQKTIAQRSADHLPRWSSLVAMGDGKLLVASLEDQSWACVDIAQDRWQQVSAMPFPVTSLAVSAALSADMLWLGNVWGGYHACEFESAGQPQARCSLVPGTQDIQQPGGVAATSDGQIFALDYWHNRLWLGAQNGAEWEVWAGQSAYETGNQSGLREEAQLVSPIGLTTLGNHLWLVDKGNDRVCMVRPKDETIIPWKALELGLASRCTGIVATPDGVLLDVGPELIMCDKQTGKRLATLIG